MGVKVLTLSQNISIVGPQLPVLCLLCVDDTAFLSSSANNLQHTLYIFYEYCNKWKLNSSKTKVIIFNGNHKDYKHIFNIGNSVPVLKILKTTNI